MPSKDLTFRCTLPREREGDGEWEKESMQEEPGFVFWILNLKGNGFPLKCCFQVLKNDSVSYQFSEPPGPSCSTSWSINGVVVVDENGDVDQKTVAYHELQKLILKGNMGGHAMYRQDCLSSGHSYKGTCNDTCAAVDVPTEATHSSQIISIIIPTGIIIIIIIGTIICCKRNHSSPSVSISSSVL